MIALLQRVSEARVVVNGNVTGEISRGILALIGVERGDAEKQVERLLQRLLAYRVFPDEDDRMNLDLRQAGGELLLVPQFTLAADTGRGRRPSFTSAAPPDLGKRLFHELLGLASKQPIQIASGSFGADMQVYLQNDGPVTFILE